MADIQQVLIDLETLFGFNPAGKATVEVPVKLVSDIVVLLKEQQERTEEQAFEESLKHIENLKWLKGYDGTTVNGKPVSEILDEIARCLKRRFKNDNRTGNGNS